MSVADVLIVGAGPVGKVLAVHLARQGHSVVVIDRNAGSYPLPRAVTHCADAARILQSIGLGPEDIPDVTEPFDDVYSWRNGVGEVLLEVDWGGRGESGWHNTYFFHQPDLEDALDQLLAGLPTVTVMRCWQAISLTQHGDAVTVVIESATDGAQTLITAAWVIGADGANSTVRGLLGIEWRDEGYFCDWLVVDVKLRGGGPGFPHVATQQCDPARPSTMVPGGPGRRRWEFMRLAQETRGELDSAEKAWDLLAPYGIVPANAELQRHCIYTFGARWATEWRSGRVFLAGDAAHLMPPFAGQGLGAGLRDAHNLAWKLSAVLRGAAGVQVLDSYTSERRQHATAFVKFSTDLGRIICVTDPQQAASRDRRMIAQRRAHATPTAPPRPGLGPGLHVRPHGGTVARQGRIRLAGTDRLGLFDDIFDGAGAVIARTAATLELIEPTLDPALRALNITMVTLSGTTQRGHVVDDVDGVYCRWLDELNVDAVLIRPDFHLFGSARARHTAALIRGFVTAAGATIPNSQSVGSR